MAKRKTKAFSFIALIIIAGVLAVGYYFYRLIYGPVLDLKNDTTAFYIHSGWDEKEVFASLMQMDIVKKPDALKFVMERKNYEGNRVVAGKYILNNKMNANDLVDHLRFGNGEVEVKIVLNSARTLPEIAGKVSQNIEADSIAILDRLTDPEIARKYGFEPETFKAMFLPDTYHAEWDTDADAFLERMAHEYKSFWTSERVQKAKNIGLSQSQVTTLA